MLDDTLFDPLDRTEDGDFTENNFRRITSSSKHDLRNTQVYPAPQTTQIGLLWVESSTR